MVMPAPVSIRSSNELPALCVGCCSNATAKIESISVEELANAWVASQSHGAAEAELQRYLSVDLGATQIEFWQCSVCTLEFARPMRSWSDEHYPQEKHSLGFDHQLALNQLAGMSSRRILEIGCADGQFLELASRQGHEALGIDFSEQDVLAARTRGVNAWHADISELGMRPAIGRFNVVALFQVIEHLAEPTRLFRTIVELAEPSALLMLGCPSPLRYTRTYSHPERIGRSDFWDYPPQHLLRWTPQSLKYFLRRFNFEPEEVVFEPLSIVSASAHLNALRNLKRDWYNTRWRRRLACSPWIFRMALDRLVGRSTGIRMFLTARLSS
jgi:SAM-dependent methyltransferase